MAGPGSTMTGMGHSIGPSGSCSKQPGSSTTRLELFPVTTLLDNQSPGTASGRSPNTVLTGVYLQCLVFSACLVSRICTTEDGIEDLSHVIMRLSFYGP